MKKILKKSTIFRCNNTIEAYSCDTPCTCGCTNTDKSPDDNDTLDTSVTKKF